MKFDNLITYTNVAYTGAFGHKFHKIEELDGGELVDVVDVLEALGVEVFGSVGESFILKTDADKLSFGIVEVPVVEAPKVKGKAAPEAPAVSPEDCPSGTCGLP